MVSIVRLSRYDSAYTTPWVSYVALPSGDEVDVRMVDCLAGNTPAIHSYIEASD